MSRHRKGGRVRTAPFSEIVADAKRSEPRRQSNAGNRAGRVNRDGLLINPEGVELHRVGAIDEAEAGKLVASGAALATESCGCGGGWCEPTWATKDEVRALHEAQPTVGKGDAPSWIDHWRGIAGDVVFLHGDYEWR